MTKPKVLVIGDSLTADGGYIKELRRLCPGCSFTKAAKGGMGTSWGLKQMEKHAGKGYNAVIILMGVNDIHNRVSMKGITKNLSRMYSMAWVYDMRVISVTLTPWLGYKTATRSMQRKTLTLNKWILAQKGKGVVSEVVDAYKALAAPGQAGTPRKLRKGLHKGDYLHLSSKAQKELGKLIFNTAFKGKVKSSSRATVQGKKMLALR